MFDIAQYIEETPASAYVVRVLLKKAMRKSYFWTEVNSNPMMRSLHGSFANQADAASYWDKLAEEKDAVVSTDACNETTVEIAFDQSCAYVDKFSRTKKAIGKEKEVKAPGQEYVDKIQRKLLVAATSSLDVYTQTQIAPARAHLHSDSLLEVANCECVRGRALRFTVRCISWMFGCWVLCWLWYACW